MASLRAERTSVRFLNLEPGEAGLLLLLALLVGTLFAGYTVAKVLRDAMFLSEFGATNLPWGYLAVALASIVIVAGESRLTGRLARSGATALGQTVAIACSLGFAAIYPVNHHFVAALFYVWTGSQLMMLLPYFWLLALELWDPRRAQAIFPYFSGAGLLGGVAGGTLANWAVERIGIDGLLWTLVAFLLVARGVTLVLDRQIPVRPFLHQAGSATSPLGIIRHSSFLRYLAATLALSVVVSTLVDFQFKFAAQQAFPNSHALTRFLGLFYAGLNGLALIVQFGAAGWLVKRTGVFYSTLPQPLSVFVLATWIVFSPIFGIIFALRWVQGVLFQTLGKSSFELYFMAVRPSDRAKIKPALDTLVERVADAAAGIALLLVLHTIGVNMRVVAGLTAIVALLWLVMLVRLQRRYVREFRNSLEQHRSDPPITAAGLRLPDARRTLVAALKSEDEHQVLLALRLAAQVRHAQIRSAVTACLTHPSPAVRAGALRALDALSVPGLEATVEPFLAEPDPDLRQAAIGYLLAQGRDPMARARALLDSPDPDLRLWTLETLVARRRMLLGAVTLAWVDVRIESGTEIDLVAAALALTLVDDPAAEERLRLLIEHPLLEVRRGALLTAARRPFAGLLEPIVLLLMDPALATEAREAVAALGLPALPALARMAEGAQGSQGRRVACETLARIGGRSAIFVLLRVVRGDDPDARFDALRALNRIREQAPRGLFKKALALRLWQREINEYRENLLPAFILRGVTDPRIALLEASFFESADRALDRACRALACYYRPDPFRSVYHYLQDPEAPKTAARALEYLSHLLPRKMFRALREIFEEDKVEEETRGVPNDGQIAGCIERAYAAGDAWLRACAVRAAFAIRDRLPIEFTPRPDEAPLVQAELAVYHAARPAEKGAP
jgi:AAA family ATP:ADP antiporter